MTVLFGALRVFDSYTAGGFGVTQLGGAEVDRMLAPARSENVMTVCWASTDRVVQRRLGETYTSGPVIGESFLMPSGAESVWEGRIPPSIRLSIEPEVLALAAVELGAPPRGGVVPNVFRVDDPVLLDVARIAARDVLGPPSGARRLVADGLSTVLAGHLLTRYRNAALPVRSPSAAFSAVQRVVAVIHDRFAEELTLQELADAARVSRFHLARVFRHHTGSSVMEYLRAVRVAEAKRLLRDESLSVAAVARSVGFSTTHLIRVFREDTGTTPALWARLRR